LPAFTGAFYEIIKFTEEDNGREMNSIDSGCPRFHACRACPAKGRHRKLEFNRSG
jgi:hypothetical protein